MIFSIFSLRRILEKGGAAERRSLKLYNYISKGYETIKINIVTNKENQNIIYNLIDKNNSNIECYFIK